MVYSVAQARKHLEAKAAVIAAETLATFKRYLDGKNADLVKELDDAVKLQAELPAFDLSQYDEVKRFEFTWLYNNAAACTVKIGEQPTPANVTMQPGATYRCYLLMRRVTEEKTA